MPSTEENKFIFENIVVQLDKLQYRINIYDTPLGKKWLDALRDNLVKKGFWKKIFASLDGQILNVTLDTS